MVDNLEDQKQSCGCNEKDGDWKVAFEEEGSGIDPLAEGRGESEVNFIVEKCPVTSRKLQSSDLVEEKEYSVVESVGEIYHLQTVGQLSSDQFVPQTGQKHSQRDVRKSLEDGVDGG